MSPDQATLDADARAAEGRAAEGRAATARRDDQNRPVDQRPFAPSTSGGARIVERVDPAKAGAEGEEMVDMSFPRDVTLLTDDGRRIDFKRGVQPVPVSMADHQWLRAHGVKRADDGKPDRTFQREQEDAAIADKRAREDAALKQARFDEDAAIAAEAAAAAAEAAGTAGTDEERAKRAEDARQASLASAEAAIAAGAKSLDAQKKAEADKKTAADPKAAPKPAA
jgi:hypothetical protein